MSDWREIAQSVQNNIEAIKGTPLNAGIQSYVDTVSTVGLIGAEEGTAFMGGLAMFCSTLPGTQFICVPMAVGFAYEWFTMVF